MRYFGHILALLIIVTLSTACATRSKTTVNDSIPSTGVSSSKPGWVWQPGINGKIGGIGVCGQHVHGITGQRELAVQRAIDEIAKQMGVRVQNVTSTHTSGTKDSAETHMDVYSIQTVEGSMVKAAVKEWWEDAKTGELYVWMTVQ